MAGVGGRDDLLLATLNPIPRNRQRQAAPEALEMLLQGGCREGFDSRQSRRALNPKPPSYAP